MERSKVQERLNGLLAAVDAAVVPLYGVFERQLTTIGSAVLMRTRSRSNLVITAGHVIDTASGKGVFTMGGDATDLIQLRGDGFTSVARNGDRGSDKVDLAGFEVDDQTVKGLLNADATFLSESILIDDYDDHAIYAFAGFPLKVNAFIRETEPDRESVFVIPRRRVIMYTKPADAKAYERARANPTLNFVATFKHQPARFYESTKAGFPHPRGMSGGAVFRVKSTSRTPYRSADINLVGIGIEYHEKPGLLVAANARALRQLLGRF